MIRTSCIRCGEALVDATEPCGFCRGERLTNAVRKLVSAAHSGGNAALLARVEAIDTLRSIGFSPDEVLLARARALDGCATAQILEELQGAEMAKAVLSTYGVVSA